MLIVDFIGSDQDRFDSLMQLFFNGEYRLVQRAAWVLSYSAQAHPELIEKYQRRLILNLNKPGLHVSVKRNTLKVLQFMNIPEDALGTLVGLCYEFIASTTESIATKAYSINLLLRICGTYPELKAELVPLLTALLNHKSAAILSCCRRGLFLLRKKSEGRSIA